MATIKIKRKRWPPNVGINNGNVRYRRQIPKDLAQVAGKTVYSEYLASLTPESSFEDAYEASKLPAARYDVLIKSLRNSSIDAYTENEIEALAMAYLKDAGLAPSSLALHMVGPEFLKKYSLEAIEGTLRRPVTTSDLMILFFPNITNPVARHEATKTQISNLRHDLGLNDKGLFTDNLKPKPTIQEIAQYRAAEVATNVRSRQPRTLSWWWHDYLQFRGLTDPSDRATQRIQRHWNRFIVRVGDHIITPDSQQIIDDVLEEQVESRLQEATPAKRFGLLMSWLSAPVFFLSVIAAPAFGHGFNSWPTEGYEKVRFGVGISDECPLEQEVFTNLFKDELSANGLQNVEWDFIEAGLYVRIECHKSDDFNNFPFYMSVSWVWEQGVDFPAIKLTDYYGAHEDAIGVGQTAYQMMKVAIKRYIEKTAPVVKEH